VGTWTSWSIRAKVWIGFNYSLLLSGLFLSIPSSLADDVIANFETGSYESWQVDGDAFGDQPATGTLPGQMSVSGFDGQGLVNTYRGGDKSTGTLTSPLFVVGRDHLSFLIGGGNLPGDVGMELLIDGQSVRSATGMDSETLAWQSWDVREFKGKSVRLRIFDRATGGWGHILIDEILQTDQPRRSQVVGRLSDYRKSGDYYREPHRPAYHFTPEIHWMNDPNGLVFFDGEYHLFYQHNPYGNEWGHMSWGHAVSTDLLHWKHLPIALHDEYDVMAFSGSAVVDDQNTSGFGIASSTPLVAIYTGHGFGRQTQDLAFSNDRGRTWTKYFGNPVIDLNESDFRDPKVFWHKEKSTWVMVVTLASQKRLQFYASSDLKSWRLLSEFGPAGVKNKPNWECPDLFELPIVNEPGKSRWVLEVDMGNGSIAGGSGGEYFTGVFDGEKFVADSLESQWVDFGRDFYAPISWSNLPTRDGRKIWIGWMNNWETALNPTYPWRSAMSIPRELNLKRIGDKLRLCQKPVRELDALRINPVNVDSLTLSDQAKVLSVRGQQLDIVTEIAVGSAKLIGLRVLKGEQQETTILYDVEKQMLSVDRTMSGNVQFHPAFAGTHSGPLAMRDGKVELRVLVDSCSVEVFGNDGETVITDLVFPNADSDGVEIFAVGGSCEVIHLAAWNLKPSMGNVGTAK
jgi:fructan beta-fructosidase